MLFAEQETDEVLSIDCETITVAGVCTCAVLACTASGFTISFIDSSSWKLLQKWSPAQVDDWFNTSVKLTSLRFNVGYS